jgi:putative RecB family exonuclease
MPQRLLSCTPTRLASYEDCPRRYRMTYLDRPSPAKGPPWAHNSLGVSVHNTLRAWWELPLERRTPSAAGALLEVCWLTAGYRDDAHSAEWRSLARGWVESYVATLQPDIEPAGLERTVGVPTARLALSGRVDRIDDRDGELVVVDYKTGRRAPSVDDVRGSRSLALYALAVARTLRRACRRVELHHLPTGTVAGWDHDDDTLARHLRRAEDTAADIVTATDALAAGAPADQVFPPRTGPHCGLCDYRRHCAEGRTVAGAREPWSVLSASPAPSRAAKE